MKWIAIPALIPLFAPAARLDAPVAPVHSVVFHLTVQDAEKRGGLEGAAVTLRSEDLERDATGHARPVPGSEKVVATATTNAWGYCVFRYEYADVQPPYESCVHTVYRIDVAREGYRSFGVCPEDNLQYQGVTGYDKARDRREFVRATTVALRRKE